MTTMNDLERIREHAQQIIDTCDFVRGGIAPPLRQQHVWWHRNPNRVGSPMLDFAASTKDTELPVRWLPFLHQGAIVRDTTIGTWMWSAARLDEKIADIRTSIARAGGRLMLDWESFSQEQNWPQRAAVAIQVLRFVLNRVALSGFFRRPDHQGTGRVREWEADVASQTALFLQVHARDGDQLREYADYVKSRLDGEPRPVHAYLHVYEDPPRRSDGLWDAQANGRQGAWVSVAELREKLRQVSEWFDFGAGPPQFVVRGGGAEAARAAGFVREWLLEHGT